MWFKKLLTNVAKGKIIDKVSKSDGEETISKLASPFIIAIIPFAVIALLFISLFVVLNQAFGNMYVIQSVDPHSRSAGLVGQGLPTDDEFYPLGAKNDAGEWLPYLEVDGNYLTSAEMDEIAVFINDSMNSAGENWGTRVAIAAWGLTYGLYQKNLMLHYRKAGKFSGSDRKTIINHNWGQVVAQSTVDYICSPTYQCGRYVNHYGDCGNGVTKYEGMDCDGFSAWAVTTGCGNNADMYSFMYKIAENGTQDYSQGVPGDLISCNNGHIMIFLKHNDDGTFMVADSGSIGSRKGVAINKMQTGSGYISSQGCALIPMTDIYNAKCKLKEWEDAI